jgi:hypothetical protein
MAETVEAAAEQLGTAVEGATVAPVEKAAVAAKVEVTMEENLFLRTTEADFLRAQVRIRDAQKGLENLVKAAEAHSKTYSEKVEALFKKYTITAATHQWNNLENKFELIKKTL